MPYRCYRHYSFAAIFAILFAIVVNSAHARGLIPRGKYELTVTVEASNRSKNTAPLRFEQCITKSRIISAEAFHLRSDHSVKQCPISDVRSNGEELIFRMICPQPNQGSARAKFVTTATGYEGTITVRSSSGATIFTEQHHARRVGECPGDGTDSVLRIDEQHWRGDPSRVNPNWRDDPAIVPTE